MDALEEPLSRSGAFPNGLFWLHRESDPILPRVVRFLERSRDAGVEVASVAVENFDEALRDLIRLIEGINTEALDAFQVGVNSHVGGNIAIEGSPYFFIVDVKLKRLSPRVMKTTIKSLEEIIESEKPAHTVYNLQIKTKTIQVEKYATVGVDTIIGE